MQLALPKISQRLNVTNLGRELLRIPLEATEPAEVSIRNVNQSAVYLYIKTKPINSSGQATQQDHGVMLSAGESFTWSPAPRGCVWYASASQPGNCLTLIEASWGD